MKVAKTDKTALDFGFEIYEGEYYMSSYVLAEAFNENHDLVIHHFSGILMLKNQSLEQYEHDYFIDDDFNRIKIYNIPVPYALAIAATVNYKVAIKLADFYIEEQKNKTLIRQPMPLITEKRLERIEQRQDLIDDYSYISFAEYCAEIGWPGPRPILKRLGQIAHSYCVENRIPWEQARKGKERFGPNFPGWRWRRDIAEYITDTYYDEAENLYKKGLIQ